MSSSPDTLAVAIERLAAAVEYAACDFPNVDDYARVNNMSAATVYEFVRAGLPHIRRGTRVQIDVKRAPEWFREEYGEGS